MQDPNKRTIEISYPRHKLARFAIALLMTAFGRKGHGRKITLKGEDGKIFEIVFFI